MRTACVPTSFQPPRGAHAFLFLTMPEARAQVTALLGAQGWNVVGEADPEFAAACWLLHNPGCWELAVVDVGLNQGSGMNSVTRFVKDGSGAVVIYTTYVSEAFRETGRLLGARATVSKRDPDELERVARALIPDLYALGPEPRVPGGGQSRIREPSNAHLCMLSDLF